MKFLKFKSAVLALVATLLTVIGCKKELDTQPFNQIVGTTAFNTPQRCLLALNGVYDAAQSGVYDPLNGTANSVRGYPFGAAAIEQKDARGEDVINVQTFYQVTYLSQYNPTSPNNVNMWKELYALINKANISIAGFTLAGTSNVLTPAVSTQYIAECRFLRAMAHHELLIHFARPYSDGSGSKLGVPFRDFPVDGQAAVELLKTKPRDSVRTVYGRILEDLDYAETNLPPNGGAGVNTIRATKAAAIALKQRIKMHMLDWTGAVAEGNKLIPATINPQSWTSVISPIGSWALTATVDGPFVNQLSSESIFSIKNDPNDNPGTNAGLSRMYASVTQGGRGLVSMSPILWNMPEWLCNDKRRTVLTQDGLTALGAAAGNSKFSKKYTDYGTYADNAPYIRYAEVLLNQAEAEARKEPGISTRAIDLLNTVRNRALNNPVTETYTLASFATRNNLIAAILAERRIEFNSEGKRWADIHRLALDPVFSTGGIPAKMANGFVNISSFVCAGPVPAPGASAITYGDYRFLWPIPLDERNTNPIVEQNPGY